MQHDRVGVVAVAGARAIDETVLVRIEHGRREDAIEPDRTRRVVVLVLVAGAARDLDHHLDGGREVGAEPWAFTRCACRQAAAGRARPDRRAAGRRSGPPARARATGSESRRVTDDAAPSLLRPIVTRRSGRRESTPAARGAAGRSAPRLPRRAIRHSALRPGRERGPTPACSRSWWRRRRPGTGAREGPPGSSTRRRRSGARRRSRSRRARSPARTMPQCGRSHQRRRIPAQRAVGRPHEDPLAHLRYLDLDASHGRRTRRSRRRPARRSPAAPAAPPSARTGS